MWPTVWLSPDWRCALRQQATSKVCLLRLTLAQQTALTLLIKASATVTVYEDTVEDSFS